MILSNVAEVAAQKDYSDVRKQDFKQIEFKQQLTPKLKVKDHSALLAAAKATLQERAETRGEKQLRTDPKVTPGGGVNLPPQVEAKKGVRTEGKIKVNKPADIQLKTPQRNQAEAKQKRQARLAELRKKLRTQ